jgi:metallo-beta-lactamase family protein
MGTLGREIVDGSKEVRILGRNHPVKATIAQIHGFSAHADQGELLRWISGLERAPRHVYVTHGEPAASESFADLLRDKTSWRISIPRYEDEVILE